MNYYSLSGRFPDSEISLDEPYFLKVKQLKDAWLSGRQVFSIQSSGSTGTPKKIELQRSQMIHSAKITGQALQLSEGAKVLIALNTEMIAGLMMVVRTLELKWEATVVVPATDPLQNLPGDIIFDFVALTPIQLNTLLTKYPKEIIGSRFKKILLGGAPVDAYLINEIADIPSEIYHSYGMTETVSHVALRKINGPGRTNDYHLLDDIAAGTDERGCLHLYGTVTGNQKIQTNDLVDFTGDRTFIWIGRADNIINSGGIKIQLDKIDRAVAQVLASLQINISFFCWSLPDQVLGQKLILVIQGENSETFNSLLKTKLRDILSKYEIPKDILYIHEFLKTPSGKTDKKATVKSALTSR